ncbi:MAG: hypothetical protein AAF988_05295 [Pseudomonadota bacterium]
MSQPVAHPMNNGSFAAKILLLGEYTIIKGSKGLAIPLPQFSASFHQAEKRDDVNIAFRLDDFHHYLTGSDILSKSMNLGQFSKDIEKGIYLNSNIPSGYGIGSSGALCAAIYARYAYDFDRKDHYTNEELNHLKDVMALMENFYHGTSSGLDCLISLVDQPVLIEERNNYKLVEQPDLDSLGKFYLFDSGQGRKTATFVYSFLEQYASDEGYKNEIDAHIEEVNALVNTATSGDKAAFKKGLETLSQFQFKNYKAMIPDHVCDLWKQGLETGEHNFKLCGAGGGGFFLVYSEDNALQGREDFIAIN